jgi:hypothetical protein
MLYDTGSRFKMFFVTNTLAYYAVVSMTVKIVYKLGPLLCLEGQDDISKVASTARFKQNFHSILSIWISFVLILIQFSINLFVF